MDKDTFFEKKLLINCRGKYLDFSKPRVMGILNITPDSFFDGGKYMEKTPMLKRIDEMVQQGTDIIDIGAFSSRPGAKEISEKEEISRLSLALGPIRNKYPNIIISVDTFRSNIAKKMIVDFGADIINDISGGMLDPLMHTVVAEYQVPYILMHMPGTPQSMQKKTSYNDLIRELIKFFVNQSEKLKMLGAKDVIIDPGFGFGKTLEQNFQLLYCLDLFKILELPILAGVSRKSMIYKLLKTTPEEALNGTIALNMLALEKGASILRVHDIEEASQVVKLYQKYTEEGTTYYRQMN